MGALMSNCIFCEVVSQNLSADIVEESDHAIAFRDISPQAPTHVLVIPKKHISSLDKASEQDCQLLGELLLMANRVAASQNLDSNYRIVINNGSKAGQSVFHIHLHVLGGRPMHWPPG